MAFPALKNDKTNKYDMLPDALKPITSKKCCMPTLVRNKPGVIRKRGREKFVSCFGTCYTERACHDPIYPYRSKEEKSMFPVDDKYNRLELAEKCRSPEKDRPPVEWCQEPRVDKKKNGTAAYLVEGSEFLKGYSILSDQPP